MSSPSQESNHGRVALSVSSPRMLVVKLSSLGDLVHALPVASMLQQRLGWTFDWVVKERYADLVRLFEPVVEVIPYPEPVRRNSLKGFVRKLRSRYYPVVLDMQGLLRSAVITRLARTGVRIGPSFHREGAWLFYDEIAGERNKQRHAIEELLDFVRHLGVSPGPVEFPIRVPDLPPLAAPRPQVLIVPRSRWPTKDWPVESFVAVAAQLVDRLHATIVLAGGKADRSTCERIAQELRRPGSVFNRAGETDLPELVTLCATVDLVITVDSGPMHLAAALGKPVLALFGPTDAVRTGPFGRSHRVLSAPVNCRPCFSRKCRFRETPAPCMADISPEDVLQAAEELLECPTAAAKEG